MSALAAIHVAKKQLRLDDDTYRAMLSRVTGKSSTRLMSERERQNVIEEMRRQGFTKALKPASLRIEGPYAKKLQALWIALWNLGLTKDRTDAGLTSFVRRQTHIDHTRFLIDAAEARKVIEALKGWMTREAGVQFTHDIGFAWMEHEAAKVAWAQWRIVSPGASLQDQSAFAQAVLDQMQVLKPSFAGKNINMLTGFDWQKINKAWGPAVRKAKRS